MIIPIKLEAEESQPETSHNTPIITFPPEPESSEETIGTREAVFGDILLPVLSKYFRLRDSKRNDFKSLLAKEHPLKIESFKKEEDKYELQLDVQKFKPEELSVKVSDDTIDIVGKHEEKADKYNYRKQEFLRRYSLPRDVKAEDVKCELSSDGQLLISAKKQQHKINISEVAVPIAHADRDKMI